MRTKIVVEVDLPSDVFGISDEKGEIIWANSVDQDAPANNKIAKALNCSPELVKEIGSAFRFLLEELEIQLAEIWKRMDKMEN